MTVVISSISEQVMLKQEDRYPKLIITSIFLLIFTWVSARPFVTRIKPDLVILSETNDFWYRFLKADKR